MGANIVLRRKAGGNITLDPIVHIDSFRPNIKKRKVLREGLDCAAGRSGHAARSVTDVDL